MKKYHYQELSTSDLPLEEVPLSEYPRPQFRRDSYLSLNGQWDLELSKSDEIPSSFTKKIIVPFAIESKLSNVNELVSSDTIIYYHKEFSLPDNFNKGRVILHIDSCDTYSDVYINNHHVYFHKGGYIPFEVDISSYLEKNNHLIIKVTDPLDGIECYGKQKVDRGGMWYTRTTGIWKSVWLESTSASYIKNIKVDVTLDEVKMKIDSNAKKKKIIIHLDDKDLVKEFEEDEISIKIPSPINWSPENPYLYHFDLISEEDTIHSYFALRTFEIKEHDGIKKFHLNDKPYFFHGLLDQGYYPDGILTPRSYSEYERDILRIKSLGFNTLRKHIKVEPLYFYYLCDKLGIIVFQDMVNNGKYHFYRDTAFPTIGFKHRNDKFFRVPKKVQETFIRTMKETVSLLYNVPSIALWTIFNESWGQFDSYRVYNIFKELDGSRFIDASSGWFDNGNPIDSQHIYFRKAKMKYKGRAMFLSEFGGYEYTLNDHRFNLDKIFGYKHFTNFSDFQKGLTTLYEEEIIPLFKKGLSASIYTQVSDVEDETNGLITYDRKVVKVSQEEMLKISDKLKY